jgi:hypothetical protein
LPLLGASANDLLNSQNNRMKSIALEKINRTSMIINCKTTHLVGKADAFD